MRETYWNKFMMTGSITDYLSYKMENDSSCGSGGKDSERELFRGRPAEGYTESSVGHEAGSGRRKEQRESDRTYRDGAFHGASGRI